MGDFGVSKRVKHGSTSLHTAIEGQYSAPEMLFGMEDENSSYTSAVDMWSLGCLIHWLLTGNLPLSRRELLPFYQERISLPKTLLTTHQFSAEAIEFICKLLERQPRDRLTAPEGLRHAWPCNPDNTSEQESGPDHQGVIDLRSSSVPAVNSSFKPHETRRKSSRLSTGPSSNLPSGTKSPEVTSIARNLSDQRSGLDISPEQNSQNMEFTSDTVSSIIDFDALEAWARSSQWDVDAETERLKKRVQEEERQHNMLKNFDHQAARALAERKVTMHVSILYAHDLEKRHMFRYPVSYAVLHLQGVLKGRTKEVKDTRNPVWGNESFDISVDRGDTISMSVIDAVDERNGKNSDGFIGSAHISVESLAARILDEDPRFLLYGADLEFESMSDLPLKQARLPTFELS